MTPLAILVGQLVLIWPVFCCMDELRSVRQPAYRNCSLRECLWFLWHVDHKGRQAFFKFTGAAMAFFLFPIIAPLLR